MWNNWFAELMNGLFKKRRSKEPKLLQCLDELQIREVEEDILNSPLPVLWHIRDCDECYQKLLRRIPPRRRDFIRKIHGSLKVRIRSN